jgi:hypothetical protein
MTQKFPVKVGHYQMTENWSVTLPVPMKRRFEEDSLVLWRKGFTIWTLVWGNDDERTQDETVEWVRENVSDAAFDIRVEKDQGLTRFSYRLNEERESGVVYALYVFAIADVGHVQMALYFDAEADLDEARAIGKSLETVDAARLA